MGKTKTPRARAVAARAELTGRALQLGERPMPLLSGALHYWRLEREAWQPALREVRQLGLPMVETYVPWSVHETAPGEHDFGARDPSKDLGAFIDLAAEEDLVVFLRPGPHINAEMTCFGLPERIVHDKACQARSPRQNPVILTFPPQMFPVPSYASSNYHREVGRWYDAVGEIVAPRIWPDGPVVMLQVDNEAAYYFRNGPYDQDYHPDALALWREFLEARYGTLDVAATAHDTRYATWDDVYPPHRFDAQRPQELPIHLDWAHFQEHLINHALGRMRHRMSGAGLGATPVVHNVPLGDGGQPVSVPAMDEVVDLVGFDYYHPAREHRTIKRRSLYLAGTCELPYAPEMGAGAPPWFTPLSHEDSLFCAMAACAYGVRGLNLYMAVDRDRWYGAPIDSRGTPRVEAGAWKHFISALQELGFHELDRRAEVGLVVPREYARLSRASHVLGMISPSTLEAIGGTPVDGAREDAFGFAGPIQVLWWRMLAKMSDALTAAQVPYVYVDSEAPRARFDQLRAIVVPTYEFLTEALWQRLTELAEAGVRVVHGPAQPVYDERMRERRFEPLPDARRVLLDTPEDAAGLVGELIDELELERSYRVTPAPLETTVHEDTQGPRVLFVINPGHRPRTATIELPGPMVLHDRMSGERFEGTETATVAMGGHTCRMLELEPRRGRSDKPPRARARRGRKR